MRTALHCCIIGGGFSGTATAIQLLRRARAPLKLTLIEPSNRLGRGVAYGTKSDRFLLNVPVARMGLAAEDEEQFFHFVRSRTASLSGGDFVARRLFGDYLASELERTVSGTPHEFSHVVGTAVSISEKDEQDLKIALSSGHVLQGFSHAVVATGNFPPSVPTVLHGIRQHARFVADPWGAAGVESIRSASRVLIVGTGLTMVDVCLDLLDNTAVGHVVAISRRGLLPQAHRPHGHPPSYGHFPPDLVGCRPTTLSYLKAIRSHARALEARGIDWREIMASLRPLTPRLWETLSTEERARFLRHVRPYWDTHRHRIASHIADRVKHYEANGRLRVLAGRIGAAVTNGQGFDARLQSRTGTETVEWFDGVVNCTGPQSDLRELHDPLVSSLLSSEMAVSDDLHLGLRVGPGGQLVRRDGSLSTRVFLVGPLLKGAYWEATAVPELRVHAHRTAEVILADS